MVQYVVTAWELNVRPAPGIDNSPVGKILRGTKVEFIKAQGDWYLVKIQASGDFEGSIEGWLNKNYLEELSEPVSGARGQFIIDTDLKESKSPFSAGLINTLFENKEGCLQGIGEPVIKAARDYRINPTYIVAHAILETGWGRSDICKEKNNLFGWNAIDVDPAGHADKFSSVAACINHVMGRINDLYLNPRGRYFREKPCLGNKQYGMNVHYALDPLWGDKIARIGRKIEDWAVAFDPPGEEPPKSSRIIDAVNVINPESPYYQPRDITGDNIKETFCNWFVADVLFYLEIRLPRYDVNDAGFYPRPHPYHGAVKMAKPYSASHLNRYLNNGGEGKWRTVTSKTQVVKLANDNKVVLASIPGSPGHIALAVPGGTAANVVVAQAGRVCSKKLALKEGFGQVDVEFFEYTG